MSSWRDQILKEFTPEVARLTLVADPDDLLTEEKILEGIRGKGFELIYYEDSIAFRFAYESKYRSKWDDGVLTDLVVVLRTKMEDLSFLPFDLYTTGRKLYFNLGELFPNLSYPVIAELKRSHLDKLYEAQIQYKPHNLGDNATKEFILRHVFKISPELINQDSDLLRVLLQCHYRGLLLPSILNEYFIQTLIKNEKFKDWPLDEIVPNRDAFFTFLQERWGAFLNRLAQETLNTFHDKGAGYGLEYKGPEDIPFNHSDVRIYIDNLFLEGMLHPVYHEDSDKLSKTWVKYGLKLDPNTDKLKRLETLIKNVSGFIPEENARYQDWFTFSSKWAELIALQFDSEIESPPSIKKDFRLLQEKVDTIFMEWVIRRYIGLHNHPPAPPIMVHHIPRALARQVTKTTNIKIALIVIDGLSLNQWIVIREELSKQHPDFRFREKCTFAWIPSVTSVSRQAIFAGKPPIYFPNSIQTVNKEESLWTLFWLNHGLKQNQIVFIKNPGINNQDIKEDIFSNPGVRIAGIVLGKVDKIMHGMELGMAGMHNQVRQWTQQGYLAQLINLLYDLKFNVILTSDHGNIEAIGFGNPSEGVIAEKRGERVRIYSSKILRDGVKQKFPESIEWPELGLPEDYLPLLASNRYAFIKKGEKIIGHGGITMEELIVPFIEIERRKK